MISRGWSPLNRGICLWQIPPFTERFGFDFHQAVRVEKGMAIQFRGMIRRWYWPAWVTLVLGLAATTWLARGVYRQAEELDRQRFKLETHVLAQLLEGTMERYEERLARLADYCAQFEEMSAAVWDFRLHEMTLPASDLPSVMHLAYCPKVVPAEFSDHFARGRAVQGEQYVFSPEVRSEREVALPVWRSWSRAGFERIRPGTDLAAETESHPAMRAALGRVRPWVSSRPTRVRKSDGRWENGFWFVLPTFKSDQVRLSPSRKPRETEDDLRARQRSFLASNATGALAVFISTDRMLDQAFNSPRLSPRVHVRLYTGAEPKPEFLLNPILPPPTRPRHREVLVLPWYVRRWALEMTSTPQFEAGSPRPRAWLVAAAGTGMTFLASALVGIALRARNRQELMTDQIREARDALAAALAERQKLSHDLHDNTIQTLYAIQLGLNQSGEKLAAEPAGARRELAAARAELDAVIAGIRRFITAEEGTEQAADLAGVLRALVERARVGTTARIEMRGDAYASERLATNQAVQLANIAREALSNSLRHARARRVDIILRSERDAVCLEIADDGAGFDPNSATRQGVGLSSMSARAKEIGGMFGLDSAPGHGTRVTVRVPAGLPGRDGELPAADEPVEA